MTKVTIADDRQPEAPELAIGQWYQHKASGELYVISLSGCLYSLTGINDGISYCGGKENIDDVFDGDRSEFSYIPHVTIQIGE